MILCQAYIGLMPGVHWSCARRTLVLCQAYIGLMPGVHWSCAGVHLCQACIANRNFKCIATQQSSSRTLIWPSQQLLHRFENVIPATDDVDTFAQMCESQQRFVYVRLALLKRTLAMGTRRCRPTFVCRVDRRGRRRRSSGSPWSWPFRRRISRERLASRSSPSR